MFSCTLNKEMIFHGCEYWYAWLNSLSRWILSSKKHNKKACRWRAFHLALKWAAQRVDSVDSHSQDEPPSNVLKLLLLSRIFNKGFQVKIFEF